METPVIIGVGDFKNKTKELRDDGQDEPIQLMLLAITKAVQDTGLSRAQGEVLQGLIDSVDVVRPWTWPYPDAAASLADKLGVNAKHAQVSPHGGNSPAKMLDEAARRISRGETKVAVVAGGEALDSVQRYMKAQRFPPPGWTQVSREALAGMNLLKPPSENAVNKSDALKGLHQVGAPIQVYPFYENGHRAHHQQSFSENHAASTDLYADFARVSSQNPFSWNHGNPPATRETIGTISKQNRMICLPYPLLMNAFNTINIAGAVILTSAAWAKKLDIPQDKWIYPLGGAGTAESDDFWMRTNFYSSPAISRSIDTALHVSDVSPDQIDAYDFYSCFPIVPKLACEHLGLPLTGGKKPITLLGGLTSFGGAGNNYSMHAISAMVRELRERNEWKNGLILANGGVLSYQHVIVLSKRPRNSAYPSQPPLPAYVDDVPVPAFDFAPHGEATIETYTVDFGREGTPARGQIIGRLVTSGKRFVANHADVKTLQQLSRMEGGKEVVGRRGWVWADPSKKGRNLFGFEQRPAL